MQEERGEGSLRAGAGGEPDWVGASMHMALAELRLYFKTAFEFTRRPGAFAAAWASGAQRALNPLGFLATSLAVFGAVKAVGQNLSKSAASSRPLWMDVALAVVPYINYAFAGMLAHGLLRLLGSRRKLSSTVAMAVYAAAGPGFGASLLAMLIIVGMHAALGVPMGVPFGAPGTPRWAMLTILSMVLLAFAAFLVPFALALMGLHRVPRLKVLAALLGAAIATAIVAGCLVQAGLDPISYTLQPQPVLMWLRDAHGHFRFVFDLWF